MADGLTWRRVRALSSVGLTLAGVAHLLVPGLLLTAARVGYRLLDVDFRPGGSAARRVRLVGVAMLVAAAVVRPDG